MERREELRLEHSWTLGSLFPLVSFMVLTMAWGTLNRPDPLVFLAGFLLTLLAVVFLGAVALVVWSNPPEKRASLWIVFVPAFLLAVPVGLLIVEILESSYGMFGGLAFMVGMGMVLLVVAPLHGVFLVVGLVVRKKTATWVGDRVAQFSGLATGGMFSVAGLIMLATLRRQEHLARTAHETPALPLVVVVSCLLLWVLWVRRGR